MDFQTNFPPTWQSLLCFMKNKQANLCSDCKSYIYMPVEENLKNQPTKQPISQTNGQMKESTMKFTNQRQLVLKIWGDEPITILGSLQRENSCSKGTEAHNHTGPSRI